MSASPVFIRSLVLALVLVLTPGCAVRHITAESGGRLEVLGPNPGFSPADPPSDWVFEGSPDKETQLAVINLQGVPALRIVNGEDGFAFTRRVQALLLVTPYLSWAWNVDARHSGIHPISILVGFHSGDPKSDSWGKRSFGWLGAAPPPHDRVLAITWGESALQRGSLMAPEEEDGGIPRYIARGGRENGGSWWLETVDLSQLYARAWPADDAAKVSLMFIGFAAAGGRPPDTARISGMVLSR